MISRYSEILHYSKLINQELVVPGHVQKIYSTSYYISLQVRVRGKSIYILIGRGGGHEGVFLISSNPKSEIRKRDKWLEWLRKYVSGSLLLDIEVDSHDRAIGLVIQRGGIRERVYVSWIGRESYFCHEVDQKIVFKSWSRQIGENGGFEIFNDVGRREIDLKQTVRSIDGDKLLVEEEWQAGKDKEASRKNKKRLVKISKIKSDIDKLSNWRDIKDWIEKTNVDELENREEIEFKSLKIKLNRNMTPFQKRDFIFKKIKSFREAEKNQINRLKNEEIIEVEFKIINHLKTISPVWADIEKKTQKISTDDEYKIYRLQGYEIGIGLSAEGNDRLRKFWAKPEDIWVHAASGKSAHAIIKLNYGVSFSIEMLCKAAGCILKQSGKSSGWLEVMYTQVKYLKSVSGTVGMVIFKKEKRITIEASEINHV